MPVHALSILVYRGEFPEEGENVHFALLVATGEDRPYRDQVLAAQPHSAAEVVARTILGPSPTPVAFVKNMAKQHVNTKMKTM